MRKFVIFLTILIIGVIIGAGGLWFYSKWAHKTQATEAAGKERKVLFYRNPMNPGVTSPTPMKDNMGMDYIPVYEDEAAGKKERKILYYRNPMNPEVTSPTPAKDSMGMDYIPVYEDESEEAPGTIRISPERIQKIGVRSEEVKRMPLKRAIRTVGRVDPVESMIYDINAKVPGWIEKLYVDRTDLMVSKGQKLLDLYSPDLVSAQEEYLIAWKSLGKVKDSPYPDVRKGAQSLLEASRQRLKYWDISDDQIKRLEESGAITRTMTIRAPSSGSVTEKMVVEGQMIEPGEPLLKIIDHSKVWVYGEVYEYEIPFIKVGQTALLSPAYSSAEVYKGKIDHIYSHLGSIRYVPEEGTEVRTAKVRFELPNKGHKLKLGMYLNVELSVNISDRALAVPDSAVIDSGKRQIVIVDRRDGTFEPREIKAGNKADGYYEIKSGIKQGEWVVTSANFLLDSESNLSAAIGATGGHQHGSPEKGEQEKEAQKAGKVEQEMQEDQGHSGHQSAEHSGHGGH